MHLIEGLIKIILKALKVFIFEFFCLWMKYSFIVFQGKMHKKPKYSLSEEFQIKCGIKYSFMPHACPYTITQQSI